MSDFVGMIAVLALTAVVVLALVVGAFLVIRDTVRKRGGWGVNTQPIHCPQCNEPAPVVRRPKNFSQMLWGGCTCEKCDTEYDKWGRAISD